MPPKRPGGMRGGRASGGTSAPASGVGAKRKRATSRADQVAGADSADEEQPLGDDELLATMESLEASKPSAVSPELLRRILHESFKDKGIRMTQEASSGFAKYLDLFIREAIRRASDEKSGTFLEVEALETAAPQLLLDF